MTDAELLRMIEERSADEWTPDEVAALRVRLPLSSDLRQVLTDRLELEGHLSGTLAEIDVTVEQILDRAKKSRSLARRKKLARVLGPLGLVVLLIGIGLWINRSRTDDSIVNVDHDVPARTEPKSVVAEVSPEDVWEPADALTAIRNVPLAEVVATKPLEPAPAVPAPEPEPAGPVEPWTAAYAPKSPLFKPDSDRLLVDFASAGHDEFPEEEARRWWTNFAGQAFNWGQDAIAGKRIARFQGTAQLRMPWRSDTLLRMTLLDSAAFEIFFWRDKEGVSLRYYTTKEPHVWAAYRVKRDDVQTNVAQRISLLTTDSGAYFRSTPGTFDLQVQHETLVLARGGIPLLTVPCGGLPDQVLLEGSCRFRGTSVHRCEPMSLPEANPHPVVFGGEHALPKLDWRPTVGTARLVVEQLADGRTKFMANAADQSSFAFTPLLRPGLFEVIVRIDEADVGAGVSLCDPTGKPLAHLAVHRDQKSQQLTIGVLLPNEIRDVSEHDVAQFPAPYFAPGQWVRLVAGLGTLQVWTSGDRLHWGHLVKNPIQDIQGAVGGIGIMALPGPMPKSLTLGHLEVRELSGLTAQADAALFDQTPNFAPEELRDGTLWIHRSLQSHPQGAEPDRWLNACALNALARGPHKDFGLMLLKRVLDGANGPDADPQLAIAAMHDAVLLSDVWDERSVLPFAERLQAIGLKQLERGGPRPTRKIRAAWLRMPLWTITSAKTAFDRLANRELIAAVAQGDWKQAVALAQECQFWITPTLPGTTLPESGQVLDRLATWVRAVAAEQQPDLAGADSTLPLAWRHPLIQQLNKEGYNLRAELDAALQGQAFDDACKLVTSLGNGEYEGLLPDLKDRQLYVSMPTAVLTALRDHPEFAAAMNRDHGQAGLLRVRQAIADGQPDVIRTATVQFLGTPAAAEAHRWLGDQQLAAGKFSEAEAHYRFALDSAAADQLDELHPRLRLAAVWNGKSSTDHFDRFPAGGLKLNEYLLSAAEFTALLEKSRGSAIIAVNPLKTVATPIAPAGYKLELKGQFDGNPGNNPGRAEFRFGDPFGKQLAWTADDKHVYLSNRFQINAYDLQTAQVRWAQGIGSEQGEAYDFAFHTMKPLIHHDYVFVRRITRAGVELCCLKRTDGTIVWKQRPMTHVLTDPAFWQGALCALIGGKVEDDQLQVELARFDLQSGAVLSTRPVVRFRDVWNQAVPCSWQPTERWASCQIGNVTACLGTDGELRWLRRPTWLPTPVDDLATDVRAPEPVSIGDRLLLAAPGTRSLDSVDVLTGRLAWRTPAPEIRGIRGVCESRVIVDLGDQLQGIDSTTGEVKWTTPVNGLLEAWSMNDTTILCARRGRGLTPAQRPNLVWLDAMTGRELAQTQLETVEKDDWQIGPIVPAGNKWWLLGGTGWKDHKRELLELVAVTANAPAPFIDIGLKHWSPELTDADRSAFASILPNWWPAADYKSRWQFVPGDVRGETRLLISRTGENQQPTWLTSKLEIPVQPSSLHFRVANQPGQKWRLVVRIENEVVLDRVLEDAATSNNWQDVAVDLSAFAGRAVLATAMHGSVDGQPSEALWKRIEILKN